ncbi:putative uncharacterized protein CXorf58 homolog isoform X2 [Oncorhynchus mykiss]|uniref:putative uncharacterized protein CXorf58 homolog isoform X2 n=1 Tax=Oncorhynchus mykiss TaxID=8022 RepID=UPI0018779574|nr:putative uncharacterized protein CXorf58 homolog isoform X2 [Oncorhynchus mykiss]
MEYGFNQEERVFSAKKIQKYWRSHQDRRLFQLMSLTVRAAEHCLAPAILRQLSPREADLVRDPSMHCKVRFRFSGSQFPPVIVFKIFHLGGGRQYISGKRVFRPSNQATTDTCRMMGNRTFINHIIADEIQRQGRMISDTSYITSMRDFMQYSSHLDELPAYLGGRENTWRFLSLQGLSRNILQWDSLEVGGKGTVADRLRQELLLLAPQIPCPLIGGAIPPRMLRSPAAPPSSVVSTARHASQPATSSTPLPSTRRSARARTSAARMRHLYILGGTPKDENNETTEKNHNPERGEQEKDMEGSVVKPEAPQIFWPLGLEEDSSENSLSDSEWEEEAEKLCLWTRQLALDDMDNVPST